MLMGIQGQDKLQGGKEGILAGYTAKVDTSDMSLLFAAREEESRATVAQVGLAGVLLRRNLEFKGS